MADVLTAFGFLGEFSSKLQCQSVITSSPVHIHVCQATEHCQTVCQDNLIWHDTTTCELWQVVHTVYTYIIITHGAAFGTFFRGYPPTTFYRSSYFQSGICVGSYHLRLVLIAGLESYSVSCSVSINCNLIVPLLRNPLIFERIAMGRCFPFFFYFPSSISFSPSSLVSSECLIFVFVPCCLFFSVNVFNFLFASHSHLFFCPTWFM